MHGGAACLAAELPPLLPTHRVRTLPRRKAGAAAPAATPNGVGVMEAWHAEGAQEVRSGLQKLLEKAGRLARGDDPASSAGREIAGALEEQIRAQRECLDWLCRASGSDSRSFAAQADSMAMQAFRKQRSGARALRALETIHRAGSKSGLALPSVPMSARSAQNPTEGEDPVQLVLTTLPSRPDRTSLVLHTRTPEMVSPVSWPAEVQSARLTSQAHSRLSMRGSPRGPVSPRSMVSGLRSSLSLRRGSEHSVSERPGTQQGIVDEHGTEVASQMIGAPADGSVHGDSHSRAHSRQSARNTPQGVRCASRLSTASAADGAKTTVLVSEPHRRGLSAGQFMSFFQQHCGDVVLEANDPERPLCMPTKLAEMCVAANRRPDVRKDRFKRLDTNLYAVNELLIMPHTKEKGVSYAELYNEKGLDVDYFVSHHWAEDFGELVQSILRHAVVCGPKVGRDWLDVAYWCCAFANNQHAVSLGKTLTESPFYLALSHECCRGTVMCLNQVASALDRIWCIYEVYLTHTLDKPFTLNSRQGPLVGANEESTAKDAWVIHIFNLLQHIDVKQADSSNEQDFAKIVEAIEKYQRQEDGQVGVDALNTTVKALLAKQAIFTLARRGDAISVRRALELGADAGEADAQGVRPLTYAAGHGHSDVIEVLLAHGADARAAESAHEVIAMWSANPAERQRAIDVVQHLEPDVHAFHAQALRTAMKEHIALRVQELAVHLRASNADLRLEVVRELRHMLQVLLEYSEEHVFEAAQHLKKLAACLGDSDVRVQREVLQVFNELGALDRELLKVQRSTIPSEHLEAIVEPQTGSTILHIAARDESANGLHVLATGTLWTENHPALRTQDAQGRTVLHLAAASGHSDSLGLLASKARQGLAQRDAAGRAPAHHAAAQGDSVVLRIIVKEGRLNQAQLAQPDASGSTIAHIAAAGGHAKFLVGLVRDFRLPPSMFAAKDLEGRNVPHILAARGDAKCLERLINECRLPPEALESTDLWSRTPAHAAAVADAADVLKVLGDASAPLHLPMGQEEPSIGAVALVQHLKGAYSCFGPDWQLGRVFYGPDRHRNVRFEYEGGVRDQSLVNLDLCTFAPTPLFLAEKLGKQKANRELTRSWACVGEALGIKKDELMQEAAKGCLPAGLLVTKGRAEDLEKLVRAGSLRPQDIKRPDGLGRSCLLRAVGTGQAVMVKTVLELGDFSLRELHAKDMQGWNVAHHAAACGDVRCLRTAAELCKLSKQALAAEDAWHRTPVHVAVEANAKDIVAELIQMGAAWHLPMGSPLHQEGTVAMVRGIKDVSWQLARISSHVFGDDRFTFKYHNGAREACVEGERCIFAPTPVLMAEHLGYDEVVEVLKVAWLDFARAVEVEEEEALWQEALQGALPVGAVAALGQVDMLKRIIEAQQVGPKDLLQLDSLGRSALHCAAGSGSAESLTAVAKLGGFPAAAVCAADTQGWNVVHHAVASDDSEAVHVAVSMFPAPPQELDIEDRWHRTPVHVAAAVDATSALRTLIDLGVPTGEPMGQKKLEEGAIILVGPEGQRLREQRRVSLGGARVEPPATWEFARVRSVVGSELVVKYKNGKIDQHLSAEHCVVAPTALELAELLDHRGCAAVIRSRGKGKFSAVAHIATFASRWTSSDHARRPGAAPLHIVGSGHRGGVGRVLELANAAGEESSQTPHAATAPARRRSSVRSGA